MRCPRCGTEAPLWAAQCAACGATLFTVPDLEGPGGALPPAAVKPPPEPLPAVPAAGEPLPSPAPPLLPPQPPPKDYRSHLVLGALLAFAGTLVVPPVLGPLAMAMGWMAYARGQGKQRTQGLLVMAGGLAATIGGTAIALWAQEAGLLTP